jgi:fatty acid desaturase
MAVEYMSLQVLVDSGGLGVGLGSNQSLTLLGYVLSNTGIVGLLFLGWFAYSVTKLVQKTLKGLRFGGIEYRNMHAWLVCTVCLLLMGLIGIPILLVPNIWIVIGILTGLSFRESSLTTMEHTARADCCLARNQHHLF